MQQTRALNDFIANTGAGFDAAGRRVYSGPFHMYGGPGDRAATMQTHAQLMNAAQMEDEESALIRKLLDDLAQSRARSMNYFNPYLSESQRPVASNGSRAISIDNSYRPPPA